MNDKLQEELARFVEKSVAGIEGGVSFLTAEIPDTINQLLVWHMMESAITSVIAVVITLLMSYITYKNVGVGELIKRNDNGHVYENHKTTLTHDKYGDVAPWIPTLMFPFLFIMVALSYVNLTWLKVLVAPKVYLLEYAAKLVGGV